jgi:tRNA pseudouridine38-40 synthase
MRRRIKLTLHYDGREFRGWQTQPGERTVQGELEGALSRLTAGPVSVLGAGRTDRGVHATGQVASAELPASWGPAEVRRALNAILPRDVWVAEAEEVPLAFHARYDAVAREYEYRVGTVEWSRSPFVRGTCWALGEALESGLLAEAAALLPGRHSFRAFAKAGQPERGELCTVLASAWERWEAGPLYRVRADRFLHHMVRYLVGTMVAVARGRRPLAEMAGLLRGEPGLETSPPAPAEGLFLTRVEYGAPGGGRAAARALDAGAAVARPTRQESGVTGTGSGNTAGGTLTEGGEQR